MTHEELLVASLLQRPGRHEARLTGFDARWLTDPVLRALLRLLLRRPMTTTALAEHVARSKPGQARDRMLAALPRIASTQPIPDADIDMAARAIMLAAKREHILDRARWAVDCIRDNRVGKAADVITQLDRELRVYDYAHAPSTGAADLAAGSLRRHDTQHESASRATPTGYRAVDAATGGGGWPGEMWLWGGFTSEGKTMCCLSAAYHAWRTAQRNVLWVPLEMSCAQVADLLVARHSVTLDPENPIPTKALRTGTLNKRQRTLLTQVADELKRSNGARFDVWKPPRTASLADVTSYLEARRHETGVDLLVVDYLEQLAPIRERRSAREELNDTLGAAKQFAETYAGGRGLWLLSPHQIRREARDACERRKPSPHYYVHDLAESARTERDSDVVAWCLRTRQLEHYRQVLVGIAKSRSSERLPYGVRLHERYEHAYVGDLADPEDALPDASVVDDYDDVE